MYPYRDFGRWKTRSLPSNNPSPQVLLAKTFQIELSTLWKSLILLYADLSSEGYVMYNVETHVQPIFFSSSNIQFIIIPEKNESL